MLRRNLRWVLGVLIALALSGATLYLTRQQWLSALANHLVLTDTPQPADLIVVLGGDLRGARIMAAVDLMNRGFASRALISGAGYLYGYHESDLAVDFALRHGARASSFVKFPYAASSTREEAHAVVRELRHMHVRKLLVVTSNFHTRRASRIFRAEAPEMEVHVASAGDTYFPVHGWWRQREARKIFLDEWLKTFAFEIGL